MNIVVLVLEYGCKPGREEIEKYHHKVADYCRAAIDKGHRIWIITCGGYTDPINLRGYSEAQLGKDLLSLHGLGEFVTLEDRSFTTDENISNAEQIVRQSMARDGYRCDKLVIFCDSIRTIKVAWLSRIIFCIHQLPIEIISFDFERTKKEKFESFFGSIKDILGISFPCMNRQALARRWRKWSGLG